MTDTPAAPTTEVATTFLAAVAGATVSGKTVTIKDVNLDELRELFTRIEAEARAAARKEVERLAAEWETAAKRIGDRALMGDPAVSVAVAQSLQSCARAILDSLSTDTREEPLEMVE